MDLFRFLPGYTTSVYDTGREPALIMLLAFLITFICARGYTRLARTRGWGSASFGGVHAHHLVFGLIIAFLAGAVEFSFSPHNNAFEVLLASVFGSGAALVLDEFALLFHLQDVYWERKGRKSVDAVVLGLIFGLLLLLQVVPLGEGPEDSSHIAFTIVLLTNLLFVIVAAVKGKLFLAVFGVFVPILAVIGALRLAEPDSAWSRRFYNPRHNKLKRSIRRYADYERVWRPRKERLWDILGGKLGRPS